MARAPARAIPILFKQINLNTFAIFHNFKKINKELNGKTTWK